jgi:hypothetical protein
VDELALALRAEHLQKLIAESRSLVAASRETLAALRSTQEEYRAHLTHLSCDLDQRKAELREMLARDFSGQVQ